MKYNESEKSSFLKFKNAQGNLVFGFFHREDMIMSADGNKALLEVLVEKENLNGSVLIHFIQETLIYGIPPTGNQTVKREQINYQEEIEMPN